MPAYGIDFDLMKILIDDRDGRWVFPVLFYGAREI